MIRRRRREVVTPETARQLLPTWVPHAAHLTHAQRERLLDDTVTVAQRFRWEAAKGLDLTDQMRVAVAGHAALLSLELPEGPDVWHKVDTIIVHPSQMVRSGSRPSHFVGVYTDDTTTIIGEAHDVGPVLVSWSAVRRQVLFHQRAGNVLLHEFAHQLDARDGSLDGTPVFPDGLDLRDDWIDVCTDVWERMQTEPHPVIDRYGATNPAEFFAVAVETFFVRPLSLFETEPALYELLAAYLGQDPRITQEASMPQAPAPGPASGPA